MRVQIQTPIYLSFTEEQANEILVSNGYSKLWVDISEDCGLTGFSSESFITKDSSGVERHVEHVLSKILSSVLVKSMMGTMKMLSEGGE